MFLQNAYPSGGPPPGQPMASPQAAAPNIQQLLAMLQGGGAGPMGSPPGLQPPPPGAAAAAGTAPSPALSQPGMLAATANDPISKLLALLKTFLPPTSMTSGLSTGGSAVPASLPGGMRQP